MSVRPSSQGVVPRARGGLVGGTLEIGKLTREALSVVTALSSGWASLIDWNARGETDECC